MVASFPGSTDQPGNEARRMESEAIAEAIRNQPACVA